MHVRYVIAVSSLAIALPLASVLAQTTTPEPAKWSFSLGVDPTRFDVTNAEPGSEARMVANLTRSWQSGIAERAISRCWLGWTRCASQIPWATRRATAR